MAVAKSAGLAPLQEQELSVNDTAMVIGGGVAGMESARNLSEQGYKTLLIERTAQLGGQARNLKSTWNGQEVGPYLENLIKSVQEDENISLFMEAELKNVDGFVGNFETTITQKG